MPVCPPKTVEERKNDPWENVVGKALKDLVTATMQYYGITRREARKVLLEEIQKSKGLNA